MNNKSPSPIVEPKTPQILQPREFEMANDVHGRLKAQVDTEWAKIKATLPPTGNDELQWVPHVHVKKVASAVEVTITPKLVPIPKEGTNGP